MLIQTKIIKPLLRPDQLKRNRLESLLDIGMQGSLSLVSAPAGYGKTVLITQWLNSRSEPSCWVALDADDSHYLLFLEYFVAALQQLFPQACPKTKKLLKAVHQVSVQTLASCLLNELNEIKTPFTIVLDDYHLINNPEVHELLRSILKHPPPSLHLIIVTRRDPPLNLSGLRARGKLTEIRTKELAFTLSETDLFLQQLGKFRLSKQAVINLQNELEGWAVGLRLISWLLMNQEDANSFLCSLHGSIPQIQEYLLQEVLALQPPIVRDWLKQASILKSFCADSLKAICWSESKAEVSAIYQNYFQEILAKDNLFVIPLDMQKKWYRYHPLFKELLWQQLQREYSPQDITALYIRASKWFESQQMLNEAFEYALKAKDMNLAVEIFKRHRMAELNAERWRQLEKWLKQLPPEIVQQQRQLLLTQGWILYYQYRLQKIPLIIEQIEILPGDEVLEPNLLTELNTLKGIVCFWQGQGEDSLEYLEKAWELIPLLSHKISLEAALHFGLALYITGQKQESIQFFQRQLEPQESSIAMTAGCSLIYTLSGQLTQALEASKQLEKCGETEHNLYVPTWGQYLQACSYLRSNNLDRALHNFRSVADNTYYIDLRAAIDSLVGLALTYQALQQIDAAKTTIAVMMEFARESGDWETLSVAGSGQARLALLQGDFFSAAKWMRGFEDAPHIPTMFCWLEVPAITQVRILIAIGSQKSLEQAIELLRFLRQGTEALYYNSQMIEIGVLQALALEKLGQREDALAALEKVIALAELGGSIRPFLELGSQMVELLRHYHPDNSQRYFRRRLLEIIEIPRVQSNVKVEMIESLTQREAEILKLISQRLHDKEIAKHLGISTTTVKSHLKHLYEKLGVHNRRQAVVQAVDLGLIFKLPKIN